MIDTPIQNVEQNYINQDEKLFQDSNRPRDQYGFRIRGWINTEKQDWKTANKNTYFDWIEALRYLDTSSTPALNYQQIPFVSSNPEDHIEVEKQGSGIALNEDWFFKIGRSWVYLISTFAQNVKWQDWTDVSLYSWAVWFYVNRGWEKKMYLSAGNLTTFLVLKAGDIIEPLCWGIYWTYWFHMLKMV